MRRRILASVLGVLAAAMVAFAIPLGIAVRSLLVDRALDQLQARLEQVALFLDDQARTCGQLQLLVAASALGETRLSLWTADGQLRASSAGVPQDVGSELIQARRGAMGRTATGDRLAVATPLSTDVCGPGTILRASFPDTALDRSIREAWLALALVGAGVLGLAAAAAAWQGRRLAEPFEGLARSARQLGDGDFSVRAPRSELPEAEAIAAALDRTAERLGRALQRSRAFTADASHQLRTPLTALRLQLEALEATGADPATVQAALAEADRLEATIGELVALTQVEGAEEQVSLEAVVRDRLAPWEALAAEQGRRLEVEVVPAPRVQVRPAAVGQALHVLLDNAFQHGHGTVTIRIGPATPDSERGTARLCVLDEGPGIDPAMAGGRVDRDRGGGPLPLSGGRGLVLARSLVEAEGGRLVVERIRGPEPDRSGTRACIVLPVAGSPASPGAPGPA